MMADLMRWNAIVFASDAALPQKWRDRRGCRASPVALYWAQHRLFSTCVAASAVVRGRARSERARLGSPLAPGALDGLRNEGLTLSIVFD